MNKRCRIYAFAVFMAAAACTSTLPGDIVVLTGRDNGREITLKKGGALELTLDSNPTTGFAWIVAEVRTAVLRLEGEPGYQPDEPAGVGGGGKQTFKFRAVAVGQTGLKLTYRRPWETDAPPAETFEITVNVR